MSNIDDKPEVIAARASELSIEQLQRLRDWMLSNPNRPASVFYSTPFEASMSNKIARLMALYAVNAGFVASDPTL